MGACSFTTRASGNTMSEAYRNAVDDAETEYGDCRLLKFFTIIF